MKKVEPALSTGNPNQGKWYLSSDLATNSFTPDT